MKKILAPLLAVVFAFLLFSPSINAAPPIAGMYLTTGQTVVGVTGAAPKAKVVQGTANQVTVTNNTSDLTWSLPASVIFPGNVQVLGTLTPTGTSYTYNDLTVVYGVNTATAVITNTGAGALDVAGGINAGTGNVAITETNGKLAAFDSTHYTNLSGANFTSLTAANISAGAVSLTTGDFSGNVRVAPGTAYTSTFTAASGNLDIAGAVTIAGAAAITGAITGPTSITGTKLVASGAGSVGLYSRAKAEILALTPAAAGQAYYCNNCTAVTICVSTGTGVGAFVKVNDRTAACD